MLVSVCLFLSLLGNAWPSSSWGLIMRPRSMFPANGSLLIGKVAIDNADRLTLGLGDCEPPYPPRRSATAWHPEGCVPLSSLSAVDDDRIVHLSKERLRPSTTHQLRVSLCCMIRDPTPRRPYEDDGAKEYL
ncbi:hypothetical protein QBC45DRAFT_58014 [Copromyces sp. CBS 386.78]|nr:hypothetical protein QBC45DRAFT_58014 [Copromyces sp. CBS 386.78]